MLTESLGHGSKYVAYRAHIMTYI